MDLRLCRYLLLLSLTIIFVMAISCEESEDHINPDFLPGFWRLTKIDGIGQEERYYVRYIFNTYPDGGDPNTGFLSICTVNENDDDGFFCELRPGQWTWVERGVELNITWRRENEPTSATIKIVELRRNKFIGDWKFSNEDQFSEWEFERENY